MSIKGLSDDVRMPRLGKIHLGYRDPDRGFPVKADYFVFPKDHQDYNTLCKLYGEYEPKLNPNGKKPKQLNVLIPDEDEEHWATQYYKAYSNTYGMICKGDGETATRMIDIKTGALPVQTKEYKTGTVTMREIPCQGKNCPEYQAKKCGEVMNLRFMLPDIPGLGVWQIDTGSINSILNINSCALLIKRTFGRIRLIPLILSLEPLQVNNPENGKKQTAYVLNLRANVTLTQLAAAAKEQANTLMLASPDMEAAFDAEVERDIAAGWPEDEPQVNRREGSPGQAEDPDWEKLKGSGQQPAKQEPIQAEVVKSETTSLTQEQEQRAEAAIKQADEVLAGKAKQDPPAQTVFVDLKWLKESLEKLQKTGLKAYNNKNMLAYIKAVFKIESTSISAAAPMLSKEQADKLTKYINDALMMADNEPPTEEIPF